METFFSDLQFRLGVWETAKKHVDLCVAGDFNVFDYISPKEPLLSRIIADLLDPRGRHGQGALFLREFICTLDLSRELVLERAMVKCEAVTTHIDQGLRRLDIEIDCDGAFGIGIENKPWAMEQIRQLAAYRDQLNRKFGGHFLLVYLTRSAEPPQSLLREDLDKLLAERRFRHITFQGRFLQWLTRCAKETEAEKVRWFVRDFAEYVKLRLPAESAGEVEP